MDWSHPSACGLIAAWSASSGQFELVKGTGTYPVVATDIFSSVGPQGKSYKGNSAANAWRQLNGITSGGTYSVLVAFADTGSTRGSIRNPFDGDSVDVNRIFQLRLDAGNTPRFIAFNTIVGNAQASGTQTSGVSNLSVMAGTLSAGQVATVFLNGLPGSTTATLAGTPKTIASTDYIGIGAMPRQVSSSQPFNGDIYCGFIWNRCLPAAEIAALSYFPFDLLIEASNDVSYNAVAAPAATEFPTLMLAGVGF